MLLSFLVIIFLFGRHEHLLAELCRPAQDVLEGFRLVLPRHTDVVHGNTGQRQEDTHAHFVRCHVARDHDQERTDDDKQRWDPQLDLDRPVDVRSGVAEVQNRTHREHDEERLDDTAVGDQDVHVADE